LETDDDDEQLAAMRSPGKKLGGRKRPASSPRRLLPSLRTTVQASSEDEHSEDLRSASDSEADDIGKRPVARPRVRERRDKRAARPAVPPLELVAAVIHLAGDGATAKGAEVTLNVLREVFHGRGARAAIERLLKAIRGHFFAGKFPSKQHQPTGTYYAQHRPLSLVGAPGEWVKDQLSLALQDADAVEADAVLRLVKPLALQTTGDEDDLDDDHDDSYDDEAANVEKFKLTIELDADLMLRLASASSVAGWADAASGAAGVAARELFAPLMTWTPSRRCLPRDLEQRLELCISRAVGVVSICDALGLRRLLSKMFALLIAAGSLLDARLRYDEDKWDTLLRQWLADLQTKARMDIFLTKTHCHAALFEAQSTERRAADRDEASTSRWQYAPSSTRPDKSMDAYRRPDADTDGQARQRPQGRSTPARPPDEPKSFVWCSLCRTPRHCLWACPDAARKIHDRVNSKRSAQQVIEGEMRRVREKYRSKGADFLSAFEARAGCSQAELLQKIIT